MMMRSPPPFSMNLAERPMPAFGDRSASPTQTFRSWPLQPGPGGMDGLTCTSSYNRLAISCISAQLCEDLCAIRRRGHLRDHWLNLPNWVREMELMFFSMSSRSASRCCSSDHVLLRRVKEAAPHLQDGVTSAPPCRSPFLLTCSPRTPQANEQRL